MLADPKSEALATRFAHSGCGCRTSRRSVPTRLLFPYWDHTLALNLVRETELFFDSLVRDDRSVLDLLSADYTFVNERVARHYGIPNVTGADFRRVGVPDERRGILGAGQHPAAHLDRRPHLAGAARQVGDGGAARLAAAAAPAERAAARRVRRRSGRQVLSVRERMEEHRKNPACSSCHNVIDPLGLALENFDVTGAWRIKDNGVSIDAAGDLYDGTKMDGPVGCVRRC